MRRPGPVLLAAAVLILTMANFREIRASPDAITVQTDQRVYALGEPNRITVQYTGFVHGDVRLGNQAQGFVNTTLQLSGGGTGTYALTSQAPSSTQTWNLTARLHYLIPGRGWQHDLRDWSRDIGVVVVPEFPVPTVVLALAMVTGLGLVGLARRRRLHPRGDSIR